MIGLANVKHADALFHKEESALNTIQLRHTLLEVWFISKSINGKINSQILQQFSRHIISNDWATYAGFMTRSLAKPACDYWPSWSNQSRVFTYWWTKLISELYSVIRKCIIWNRHPMMAKYFIMETIESAGICLYDHRDRQWSVVETNSEEAKVRGCTQLLSSYSTSSVMLDFSIKVENIYSDYNKAAIINTITKEYFQNVLLFSTHFLIVST